MSTDATAHVLVVDDDPRLRELVRYALTRAGFNVSEAGDGRAALHALRLRQPDLVVLDVIMPELDGIAVCKEIRATWDIPVIFLSSRGEEADRVLGLDLGGDDYLGKPFAPDELVSRVRAILRRSKRPAAVADGGGVRVDVTRFRAWAGESELALTRTEFRMLQALLSAEGRVLSRDQLVRASWDQPHFVADRTVDSHIRGVRNKLRAAGHDRVETVTGVGWRWNA